jgi:cobalamin biosynthesis protein CobW
MLQAESTVRQLAPSIRFIELAYQAKLDTRLTLGLHLHEVSGSGHRHYGPVSSLPLNLRPLANQALLDGHSHGGLAAHSHGLATHKHFHEQDPGWQSFLIRSKDAQDPARLLAAVETIAREEALLRIKGHAASADGQGRLTLQAVRQRVQLQQERTLPRHGRRSWCSSATTPADRALWSCCAHSPAPTGSASLIRQAIRRKPP